MNFTLPRLQIINPDGPIPGTVGKIQGAPFSIMTMERNDKIIPPGLYHLEYGFMFSHGVHRAQIIVPGRTGIFVHSIQDEPNEESQLEGCVGVGDKKSAVDRLSGGVADHIADRFAELVRQNPNSILEILPIPEPV